uniref:Uncharacterized protein n=1 Tax=Manihot esculenta TaxID=3983 RepID=A0A2C9WLU9_MANES
MLDSSLMVINKLSLVHTCTKTICILSKYTEMHGEAITNYI